MSKIEQFELERFFAKYEFSAKYLLGASDCESLSVQELLANSKTPTKQLWSELNLGYTESLGHPLLREEISKLYQEINSDEIIVLAPEEGIFVAMQTILSPGDHVVTTFPAYQSLYSLAKSIGCSVSYWEPERANPWEFSVKTLKSLVQENTKLIIINFPHNPTGATISKKELHEIVNFIEEKNILLFSDEMYRYLEYDESQRLPSASELSLNAVSLSGLSKSFALAGLRIGWLSTKNKTLFQEFATYKDYTTICNSAPSEILGIIALEQKKEIVNRNLSIIEKNLAALDRFFAEQNSLFNWYRPVAGPIAFPEYLGTDDVYTFSKNLVEKEGILIIPANQFHYQGQFLRFGFGRNNVIEALEILSHYLSG